MAYEIQAEPEKGYVKAVYHCPIDLSECKQARVEIIEKCEEHNIHKIVLDLTDVEVETGLSMTDCFFLADSRWSEEKPIRRLQLACIMPRGRDERKFVSFYLIVAQNRGAFIKGFEDIESAEAWLADK